MSLSRRRVIAISGLFAGAALAAQAFPRRHDPQLIRWEGQVLGAVASLELYHPDVAAAEALVADCLGEIDRLERIFSLYRPSALTRLNRDGRLDAPPPELVYLLREGVRFSTISHGAFDVTVQPLWTLYANHFARDDADPAGPPAKAVAAARDLVDYRRVQLSDTQVRLGEPAMSITLNSIGQGFITDCVVSLLRRRGIDRILADLGEYRALGGHPDGRPWHVGIGNPKDPDTPLGVIELRDRAVATSGGYGTVFDRAGHFHHLFDPATGRSAFSWAETTVVASSATIANGLSTALAVAPPERAAEILRAGGGEVAYLIDADNRMTTLRG